MNCLVTNSSTAELLLK
ncbi:hypothetical protein AB2D81_14530 [Escherichia coli]